MALLLTEQDVQGLLTMSLALETVEQAFRDLADGTFILHGRRRIHMPNKGFLHYMAAADFIGGYAGLKIYTYAAGALRFLVPLFRWDSGELVALIEANFMGQVRTGAASGVATKFMARNDARTVGLIGTGTQAPTQVEAVCAVRLIERVRVFGRNPERRQQFARRLAQKVACTVEPVDSAEQAVREADVVLTATTAGHPVVESSWLKPGVHINAVGNNQAQKRELDEQTVRRAGVIATDSLEQARMEAGELIQVFGADAGSWSRVVDLAQIVVGAAVGRHSPGELTLFKSNGVAIEDIAVGGRVYELARERGIGREVPLFAGP
ncbi:MAG TPA: ornithine cyclodeaminase family protein [Candidatus Acidoferrales bacterium]|nr:ornithine cyclodeaminase family protein [Candidatus Acidoferrales bacterium]